MQKIDKVKVFNEKGMGGIYGGVYLIGSNNKLTPINLLPPKPAQDFSSEFL